MAKRLMPILHRGLVDKIVQPAKLNSGILLPGTSTKLFPFVNRHLCYSGKVVAFVPGLSNQGEHVPTSVKEGETGLLPEYGESIAKLGEKEFHQCRLLLKSRYLHAKRTSYNPFLHSLLESKTNFSAKQSEPVPFLLNLETRLDVTLVRLHFCETLPQARQLISHGKVCVNNGVVKTNNLKVSHGDLISFPENEAKTRLEEIRKYFYSNILVDKIIGKLRDRKFRTLKQKQEHLRLLKRKNEWFRLLKTKNGCRLLLKSRFLQKLHSSMQEKGSERPRPGDRMKRSSYHSSTMALFLSKKRRIKHKIKRIQLPTHYMEVNYKTLKAVVFYGPNIDYVPKDIRLRDPNVPLLSGMGRGRRR